MESNYPNHNTVATHLPYAYTSQHLVVHDVSRWSNVTCMLPYMDNYEYTHTIHTYRDTTMYMYTHLLPAGKSNEI